MPPTIPTRRQKSPSCDNQRLSSLCYFYIVIQFIIFFKYSILRKNILDRLQWAGNEAPWQSILRFILRYRTRLFILQKKDIRLHSGEFFGSARAHYRIMCISLKWRVFGFKRWFPWKLPQLCPWRYWSLWNRPSGAFYGSWGSYIPKFFPQTSPAFGHSSAPKPLWSCLADGILCLGFEFDRCCFDS